MLSDRVAEIHRSVLAKTVHELKSGVEGGSPDESYMTRSLFFLFSLALLVALDATRDRPKNVDVPDQAVTPALVKMSCDTMMGTKVETTFMVTD